MLHCTVNIDIDKGEGRQNSQKTVAVKIRGLEIESRIKRQIKKVSHKSEIKVELKEKTVKQTLKTNPRLKYPKQSLKDKLKQILAQRQIRMTQPKAFTSSGTNLDT